ncbi:SapC family protein [uncultured Alsobacter sp.]|uniref:SapC family protein n=1 Tax=uncultured Alsobacter sp. TaxID=1748258 RepID=UPI0025FA9DBA|nr:SapC family protein [uncultured Alsobacter sp.]
MTKQLLIYDLISAVSAETHRELSVREVGHFGFSAGTNHVPLMLSEFVQASGDMPIVFAGGPGDRIPVAVLGFRDGENRFLDVGGTWRGRYVPAFLRRYPFVFANTAPDTLTLCIDETYPGCNRDGRGERLFDADGQHTTYLRNVLAFAQAYEQQLAATRAFCARLEALDLLEPAEAQWTPTAGDPMKLTGFSTVERARLRKLTGEQLAALTADDLLEPIFAQLLSLGRFEQLATMEPAARLN